MDREVGYMYIAFIILNVVLVTALLIVIILEEIKED
jgi:hypothetical protein